MSYKTPVRALLVDVAQERTRNSSGYFWSLYYLFFVTIGSLAFFQSPRGWAGTLIGIACVVMLFAPGFITLTNRFYGR